MNCPKVDKLSQYVDNLLTVQEHDQIHAHVKSCDDCIRVVEAFQEEQRFLKETLQTPTLPDDFASIVLDKIEPYEQKIVRRKSKPWKRILLSAAGIVLVLGLTAALNPQEATDKLTIKFDLVELNGVKGNWKLEVPVDLIENKKLTKTIPLSDAKKSAHGVVVNMKEVQFAPSSNDLSYETSFTNEEQALVKEKIQKFEEKFGEEKVNTSTSYGTAIQYHIENEEKKTIYYRNNSLLEEKGEHYSLRMLSGAGEDMEQLGQVAWNESYIPQKVNNKLTFVLDGVFKTVPSDFSITIKPKELKKHPVSFEYEGNFITINKATMQSEFSLRKSLIPVEKETIFQIEMKGGKEALSSEFGTWILVDEKGNAYPTNQSGSILNEKDKNDRYKLNLNLKTYDLEEIPEELTLHLLSVTRYYEVKDKWQVPLY
ncbi:zf-HC2 domain-containing protein [Psychrobacillus sp. FSL H8-0484]|uniref:anti-sigma factor family protein n=1 Tax=Psychrobacillus sp. FSL H8-0484 TaxID=2921390 RepID=UPI0030F80629